MAASPVAAAATLAGVPAPPDHAAVASRVAPVHGAARRAMHEATTRAQTREKTELRHLDPAQRARRWREEGHRRLDDAVAAYAAGDRLDNDQTAWLATLLTSVRVRDEALVRLMNAADRAPHLALRQDARRAEPGYVPAPATLAAFTAWQKGDDALAHAAVDRALDADPTYRMAQLLRRALAVGLPPQRFTASDDDLPAYDA